MLDPIAASGALMDAWADEPWTQEGAAVRVSMVSFGEGFVARRLNGNPVAQINADLTGGEVDLTQAKRLKQNLTASCNGSQKTGPFDVTGEQAREWLRAPLNPNGRPNSDVLRPYWNGIDVTRRPRDTWIIDFFGMREDEASLYELPFRHALLFVQPFRQNLGVSNEQARNKLASRWWLFERPRPELRRLQGRSDRVLVTPEIARHRVFVWAVPRVGLDKNLTVVARDDDTTFGIVHSRFHELWALRMGTWLGVGNDLRYTPSTTFETFPFPEGLTPDIPAAHYADDPRAQAIAAAAAELNRLREAWLNPADLVRVEPEVVAGYPDRILPVSDEAAKVLKTRTLTNLYNQRPAWLDAAHRRLDAAVAAAYGWPANLSDDEVLARLFALNQERAGQGM